MRRAVNNRTSLRLLLVFLGISLCGAAVRNDQIDVEGIEHQQIENNVRTTVEYLSREVGQRSWSNVETLAGVAGYLHDRFKAYGLDVRREPFVHRGKTYYNIVAEVKGSAPPGDGILIIGAHYDTVAGTPGADDNASGVAGLLELARLARLAPPRRTTRFVAFSLEEPPVFGTEGMGSYIHAANSKKEGVAVYGMISLEMIGFYCDRTGCQRYPFFLLEWFFPSKGDFIAFAGDRRSRRFLLQVRDRFTSAARMPVETLTVMPHTVGSDLSDHRNFWSFGYPAFMITDTSFFRNAHYHTPDDTHDILDYQRMAALIKGLHLALRDM